MRAGLQLQLRMRLRLERRQRWMVVLLRMVELMLLQMLLLLLLLLLLLALLLLQLNVLALAAVCLARRHPVGGPSDVPNLSQQPGRQRKERHGVWSGRGIISQIQIRKRYFGTRRHGTVRLARFGSACML